MSRSAPPAARSAASLALAGARAFAVGSGAAVLALLGAWAVGGGGWPVAAGFGLGGGVGGYLLERARALPVRWPGALGLGLGFAVFGVVVSFSLVSLQGGADPAYGAASWGIALGVAGVVAGPFLAGRRSRLPALAARTAVVAAALAVAGIAGGAATFAAAAASHPATVLVGLSFTWVVAGALLAAAVTWLDRRPAAAGRLSQRPPGLAERAAWAAAAFALLGLVLAMLFPLRLRLPGDLFVGGMTVLGIRGAAAQAAGLLALPGLAASALGGVALRRATGLWRGERTAALTGLLAGGLLVASSLALVVSPAGRSFEAAHARAQLASVAGRQGNWNHGNVVHWAHITLGRVALGRGDRAAAVEHLLAAGRTPGSPQLDSFGPDLGLAAELLAAGERQAVVEYLGLCRRFWRRQELLDRWVRELEAGATPDLGTQAKRR